ncbi:MAG TPA: hypothetical protein PLC65_12270 [Bacteroidia bacterium]|nr:hypothetical protein [Bacteroidia bacterium]
MEGGIFLTIKDLQKLLGTDSYVTANREHLSIRDALGKKSKHLTIKEYCEYEELDFTYVWDFLRGEKNKANK